MSLSPAPALSLAAFLQQPGIEASPAWEYLDGQAVRKVTPQGQHSTLQSELVTAVNQVGKPSKTISAFPERRCTFGDRSLVPDIAAIA